MKKILGLLLLFCTVFVGSLFAQEAEQPAILLMYFSDIEIVTPDDEILYEEELEEEMQLPVGATIMTGTFGLAELELRYPGDPYGGTIIKLAEDTVFTIDAVAGLNNPDTSIFSLAQGKARAIKDAIFNKDNQVFETPSGVCGVRGTDYGVHVDPGLGIDDAYVLDGLIDYSKKGADGSRQTIPLGRGQMASSRGDNFQPVEIPPAALAVLTESMGFERLKDKAERMKERKREPTPEPTPEPTEEPVPEVTPEPSPTPTEDPLPLPEDDPLMKWLKDVLGMEIGSITIGEKLTPKPLCSQLSKLGN